MNKGRAFFFMLLMVPLAAAAAEGGGHHFDWLGFLGRIFNSVVLFGGLIYFLRKPLLALLARRSSDIRQDIDNRQVELTANSQNLAMIQQRLSRIESEIEQIRGSAQESGRNEMAKLEGFGRREADKIVRLSEEEINRRMQAAVRQLKEKIADLTIDRLKSDLGKNLDAAAHRRIIAKNIERSQNLDERK